MKWKDFKKEKGDTTIWGYWKWKNLYLHKYKVTKSTHIRECWILKEKLQSHSKCMFKDDSHLIRKDDMINHLIRYDYLMIEESFDDEWVICKQEIWRDHW